MKFSAHNLRGDSNMSIINLNDEKIAKINKEDLSIINSIFKKEESVLNYFGYEIIE